MEITTNVRWKKKKMMSIWRYKKTVQKWRWCYTSCLVRASETLHITAFRDLRNIANFTAERLDSQTWVRFLLGIDSYSCADDSFNASTMLNTSWGWVHFGTILRCTLNCVFPNHFQRTVLLCLGASVPTFICGTGLAGLPMIYSFAWHYFCIVNISFSL